MSMDSKQIGDVASKLIEWMNDTGDPGGAFKVGEYDVIEIWSGRFGFEFTHIKTRDLPAGVFKHWAYSTEGPRTDFLGNVESPIGDKG